MRIERYSFGRISIDGKTYQQDIKIVGNRVIPDWWRKSGHRVAIEDIEDILAVHPEIVVFGKGDPGRMDLEPEVAERLREDGIELIELPTARAAEEFNRLVEENRHVAAGFHLTC